MADQSFGKFKSVGEFLEAYKKAQEREQAEVEKELPFEERVRRRRERTCSVIEVAASLKHREPDDTDGDRHVRLIVTVTELLEGNPGVNADVQQVLDEGDDVFVAIRIGDSMGITQSFLGLVEGVTLDMKGSGSPRTVSKPTAAGRPQSCTSHTIPSGSSASPSRRPAIADPRADSLIAPRPELCHARIVTATPRSAHQCPEVGLRNR